jgi:hypothetical protein
MGSVTLNRALYKTMKRAVVLSFLSVYVWITSGFSSGSEAASTPGRHSGRSDEGHRPCLDSTLAPAFQSAQIPPTQRGTLREDPCHQIFEQIERGLSSGNIGEFSPHFASQVLVNLRGAESGYLSANQSFYVLENYLKTHKIANFSFTTFGESELNPYATGSAGLNVKGGREIAQVYVSLSHSGDHWVIAQINVY